VFGTAKKATGTPYVFGMINDETGAVTFPEARQGAIAAANYVNNYLGGINGHPIVIDNCTGDGTPATAARCANQLVAKHPIAILGRGRRRRRPPRSRSTSTPTWPTWAASRSPRSP
jgi:branched-chain amino acid transport system substrate-binding protein